MVASRTKWLILSIGAIAIGACFAELDESLLTKPGADGGIPDSGTVEDGAADSAIPYRGLECGDAELCQPPSAVCCSQTNGDKDRSHGICRSVSDCTDGTSDFFACSRPADCTYTGTEGTHCCFSEGTNTRSECHASCTGRELCDFHAPTCPTGQSCRASLDLVGLFECKN